MIKVWKDVGQAIKPASGACFIQKVSWYINYDSLPLKDICQTIKSAPGACFTQKVNWYINYDSLALKRYQPSNQACIWGMFHTKIVDILIMKVCLWKDIVKQLSLHLGHV